MPESVRNRCTKAHEYVFLLTKGMRYYCDMEAIREKSAWVDESGRPLDAWGRVVTAKQYGNNLPDPRDTGEGLPRTMGANVIDGKRNKRSVWTADDGRGLLDWLAANGSEALARYLEEARNKGDVWTVSSQGYPGAHFATYPPALIEPMIRAGTSEAGACSTCGAPWRRVVEERKLTRERPNDYVKRNGEEGTGNSCPNSAAGVEVTTTGWEPGCDCEGAEVRPCIVLDPFLGSGTTAEVCVGLGRWCWGVDLSEEYLKKNAVVRVSGALLSRPLLAWLVPVKVERVSVGRRLS
jgi:hypothetical protein